MTSRHFSTWTYVAIWYYIIFIESIVLSRNSSEFLLALSVSYFYFLRMKCINIKKGKKNNKPLSYNFFKYLSNLFPIFFFFSLLHWINKFHSLGKNKWPFDYCIIRSTNPQFILTSCIIPVRAYRWLQMITAHFPCSYLSIQSH